MRHREDERGVSALLLALTLLLIMGFAAIAVDASLAKNIRRQDQSAADFAALAAVQFAQPNSGCSGSACFNQAVANGTAEAIAVANATLDDPSKADWSDPAECGTAPAGFAVSPSTNCVAFSSNLQRAWVHVPTIESETAFGRLLGADEIDTTAEAIARATAGGGASALLPLLSPGSMAANNYDCLKTSGNPDWGSCEDLPATGNFGSGDFFLYGNVDVGTTERCSGGTNGRLVSNLARGVDHPLGKHPTGSGGGKVERSLCPLFSAEPNMVQGQPGVGSNLDDGLTRGGSVYSSTGAYPGRIADPTGYLVRNAQGPNPATYLDNTPLWDHLLSFGSGPCSSVSDPASMQSCLTWAKAGNTVIFDASIASAKRYGFTPLLWEMNFGNPSTVYHIRDFLPVYLDSTYYACNNNSCSIVHTPGVADSGNCPNQPAFITCGTPGGGNRGLDAVTAYILERDILPPIAQNPFPGEDNQRAYELER